MIYHLGSRIHPDPYASVPSFAMVSFWHSRSQAVRCLLRVLGSMRRRLSVFASFAEYQNFRVLAQGKAKKTRKFAAMKRTIHPKDQRL